MTIKGNVLHLKNVDLAIDKIEELEKENAELKKDKEYLDKVNNEQTEVILKLNKQIDKMKNCQNCKHDRYRVCISEIRCENLEQWECIE